MALMGFGDFDDIFGQADRMMNNMMRSMFGETHSIMDEMMAMMPRTPFPRFPAVPSPLALTAMSPFAMMANANANNTYSYSSVMTMSSSGYGGQPQVYEETHSTRCGPNGVKETRSSVRDSMSGYQKMSVGHHIQDRAHITSRSRNYYTGEEEHNDEYINLEEEEAETFNHEWKEKTKHGFTGAHRHHRHIHRQLPPVPDNEPEIEVLALPAPPSHTQQQPLQQQSSSINDTRPIASTSNYRESPIPSKHKLSSMKQRTKRSKKAYKNI